MNNLTAAEVYAQFYGKVASYVHARIRNMEAAEDLIGDVFLRIVQKIESYDAQKASVSTWVYTITHNMVCNYYRSTRGKEQTAKEETLPEAIQEEDALANLCSRETLQQLAQALLKLPERERILIVLRFYRGYTHKQTAQALHISETNSKFLQNKAMKSLKVLLGRMITAAD
ncbi:MAG: sigma-70 family RNA polymerase sigma factor [Christensenella sp.]|nr:sigma-70 family RNA polymerase sigma factor [Christensenella sp.]